jgi:uncharacterized membrane protein YdbT with pleckstrin-like domain
MSSTNVKVGWVTVSSFVMVAFVIAFFITWIYVEAYRMWCYKPKNKKKSSSGLVSATQ